MTQVERGFHLALNAVPLAATQQLLAALTEVYPSYASRILVVNLPSYLAWFVRFVKGLVAEGSANKFELVTSYERLLDFLDELGLDKVTVFGAPHTHALRALTHARRAAMQAPPCARACRRCPTTPPRPPSLAMRMAHERVAQWRA